MNRKIIRFLFVAFILVMLIISSFYIKKQDSAHILEVGIFVRSNWDVANANSYVIIDKAIKRFESEHKNVKIHYSSGILKEDYSEWLAQQMLLGKTPDVFMILSKDMDQFTSLGVIKNLEELMYQDKLFRKEDYFSTTLASGEYNGVQYALPYETVPTMMFVNKTLLEKEGIPVPTSDWTWEDLYRISQQVTKDNDGDGILDQFGTYNYDWIDAAYTNGTILFDEKDTEINLSDVKVNQAVKFTKQLYDQNQGRKVTQEDFDSGNVAFMPLPFSEYRTYKTYPYKIKKYLSFQWDCITLPAGDNGGNVSEVNSLMMGISAHTENEQLAWEFLKLLTYDKEIQMDIFRYSQAASVLKEVTRSKEAEVILQEDMEESEKVIDNELLSRVIEQGTTAPQILKYKEAIALANSEIQEIIENNKNIESSLKILQRKINQYMKQ